MLFRIKESGSAVMYDQATVILATRDSALLASLRDSLRDVRVMQIGSEPLRVPVSGRVWCFVDWLLPLISGLEVCRRLRESPMTAQSHITMVLDEDDSDIRRRALRAGADNYVPGPLSMEIVIDRLGQYRTVVPANFGPRRVSNGPVTLDVAAHQMRYRNRVIPLRPNEFRLLTHFFEHPDQLFTRNQLITMLGKDCGEIDERTVDVWVGRLRRSLKAHGVPDQLRTVRSMGYVLDSVSDAETTHAA
jgi:two-component system phosphate regulon response regulator PhoB